jgi:triosephosphate isomerase
VKVPAKILAGNWKMNQGPNEAESFFGELREKWDATLSDGARSRFSGGDAAIWLFPPAITLDRARALATPLGITIGAQNAHGAVSGAFTGELSAPLLAQIGISTVLLGHSERRQYFGDTDESLLQRAEGLLAQKVALLICVGETRAERESGQTRQVLLKQLSGLLASPALKTAFESGQAHIAYEPVWAIGTGLTATPDQAEEAHQFIRNELNTKLGAKASQTCRILYGGSVTPENIATLMNRPGIDGALVGGASLKPGVWLELVDRALKAPNT